MKRVLTTIALSAALLVGAAACGSSDVSKDKFQSELVKRAELTEAQATCVANASFKDLTQEEINDIYTADVGEVEKPLEDKFSEILTGCLTAE